MRYTIWSKDDFFEFLDGRTYTLDAQDIELHQEPIPVFWMYDHMKEPLGKCSDIRIENGDLTAEVEWWELSLIDDEYMESVGCRLGGFFGDVKFLEPMGHRKTITSCVLRSVSVVLDKTRPGHYGNPALSDIRNSH